MKLAFLDGINVTLLKSRSCVISSDYQLLKQQIIAQYL